MEALRHWFEPSQDTARYILAHFLAERRCLVCGADPAPNIPEIEMRLRQAQCPVCGSSHQRQRPAADIPAVDAARINRLEKEIALADEKIATADRNIQDAINAFTNAERAFEELRRRSIMLDQELVRLLRIIPTDRAALASAEDEIDTLRRILDSDRVKRDDAAAHFNVLIDKATKRIQKVQNEVITRFERFIKLFLLEDAALVYQTVQARVAQSLAMFTFPIFRLAMSGAAVPGTVVREGLDAVSQSQAEFVDLAFRMALMTTTTPEASTLVIDAPEASLDFLFATRGGYQLAGYAKLRGLPR